MNPAPLRSAGWLAALAASLAGLLALGDRLAPPPLLDPAAAWTWLRLTDPATATFALVRVAAIATVAYLLAVTVLAVVAEATQVRPLLAASRRVTLPAVRRLVRHAVGAGVAVGLAASTAPVVAGAQVPATTATVVPPTATPTTPADEAPPVLRHLDDDPVLVHLGAAPDPAQPQHRPDPEPAPEPDATSTLAPPITTVPTEPRRPPPAPMATADPPAPVPSAEPPASGAPAGSASGPADPAAAAPPTTPGEAPPPDAGTATGPVEAPSTTATATAAAHTIVTGDHLWGVAEQTLTAAWGAAPDPDDVADYLHRLVDANRSILAVPGDPDLVFPGQVFTLPAAPAR